VIYLEIRKVQRLGSSSYIVTLPASWVRKNNIKAGDPVIILEEEDALKIKPRNNEPNRKILKVDLGRISDADLSENVIKCLLSLGFDSINLEYSQELEKIIDKLKDKIDAKISFVKNSIEISVKNDKAPFTEDLKDIGKIVISFIEELIKDYKDEEISSAQFRVVEKLLEAKFFEIRRKIFKELSFINDQEALFIATTEIYALINELYLVSLRLLRLARGIISSELVAEPLLKNILISYATSLWELFAGIANSSIKRIAYSKSRFDELIEKINELNITPEAREILSLLIRDSSYIAKRAEVCMKTKQIIEEKSSKRKEKPLPKEIII